MTQPRSDLSESTVQVPGISFVIFLSRLKVICQRCWKWFVYDFFPSSNCTSMYLRRDESSSSGNDYVQIIVPQDDDAIVLEVLPHWPRGFTCKDGATGTHAFGKATVIRIVYLFRAGYRLFSCQYFSDRHFYIIHIAEVSPKWPLLSFESKEEDRDKKT